MMPTVLLVDEDHAIRTLCNHVLTGCGVDILAFGSCEAIEVLNQFHGSIDLLLSDTLRCGFSGTQLALMLLRARPAMRILLMCSHHAMS